MYEFFGQPHSESLKAMYVPFPYQKYMRHRVTSLEQLSVAEFSGN